MTPADIKTEILRLTREYSRLTHAANRPANDPQRTPHQDGQTIPYAGRVFTEDEVEAAVSSTLDFWLTLGPEGEAMEKELAAFMGVKHCLLVNSGSSANLIAFSALTTHKLPDHKRIRPGDEVITVAAGFPTTVAPIIQCGAVPVFIDAKVQTGNANCSLLEAAYSPGKTKAVMMAHALGNPFELSVVLEFCQKYDLWLIEDNCDALGCTYTLPLDKAKSLGLDHLIKIAEKGEHSIIRIHGPEDKDQGPGIIEDTRSSSSTDTCHPTPDSSSSPDLRPSTLGLSDSSLLYLTAPTGSFGDISTQSFYPPHHLTMGEGGSVNIIRRAPLKTYAESFRDWGRDCWCPSGKDDTCGKRFQWQLGELPEGYDHKYIYSHLGYNVKPLDIQAAIGRVQVRRLPEFIEARKRNWEQLRRGLHGLESYMEFALPTHATAWVPPEEREQESGDGYQKSGDRDQESANSEDKSAAVSSSLTDTCHLPPDSSVSITEPSSTFRPSDLRPLDSSFLWDESGCRSDCSWFGFKITVKESAPFTRTDLVRHLDQHKIGNRMLFGGNLVRQPAFVQLRRDRPDAMRIATELTEADRIMNQTFFLGTYPGLTHEQIDYMAKVISDFVKSCI